MSHEEDFLEYERERARLEHDEDSLDIISPEDSKDSPKLDESTPDGDSNLKLAIVVGHSKRSPGLLGTSPVAMSEYDWNVTLAEALIARAKADKVPCKVFFRDGVGIEGAYKAAETWGTKAAVELHFNVYNQKFRGSATLHGDRSVKSADYARVTHGMIITSLGTADRGVVLRTDETRGAKSVGSLAVPSILVEPFFGDNPEDAALASPKRDALARAIVDGFVAFAKKS